MKIFEALNDVQSNAVKKTEGPVLIFAGAGSGKTRVLTARIAYLVEKKGVSPSNILGVTFTNKAASEMKQRISSIIGPEAKQLNMGTFHSICAKMLRIDAHHLGFERNFAIYDADDQLSLIKKLMEQYHVSTDMFKPKAIQSTISNAKNEMIMPDTFEAKAGSMFEEKTATIYKVYQKRLRKNNAMDFDDLLLKPLELFEKQPEVLKRYQRMYQYIMVDEYQDTNKAQFEFIKRLGWTHKNVCVVGDDDQSIYRWRGADVSNILDFEEIFPECTVFKLEQNYRSTQNILSAASAVVSNNSVRAEKKLWSAGKEGEKVSIIEANDEREEANRILKQIQQEIFSQKRTFNDFVLLYRTNAQSRALEDALRQHGIQYVIIGGVKFYSRKEIKDVLAYLRAIVNPNDAVAMRRIINVPTRGIGATTEERLDEYALEHSLTFWDAMQLAKQVDIHAGLTSKVLSFVEIIRKYMELKDTLPLEELVGVLLEDVGMIKMYKDDGSDEALDRLENIYALIEGISDYVARTEEPSLEGFLEEVSLLTDIDNWDDDTNAVTLMTLHSAKGLEFPVVFITGAEEGLFPLGRANDDPEELAEERRLFYVGMTRAQDKVYVSYARQRSRFGDIMFNAPSRFVGEIPEDLVTRETGQPQRRHSTTKSRYKSSVSSNGNSRKSRSSKSKNDYSVGDVVQHKIFGRGKIVSVSGSGENQKLSVVFTGNMKKKLLAKYANLTSPNE